jgi:hypothetical protein
VTGQLAAQRPGSSKQAPQRGTELALPPPLNLDDADPFVELALQVHGCLGPPAAQDGRRYAECGRSVGERPDYFEHAAAERFGDVNDCALTLAQ